MNRTLIRCSIIGGLVLASLVPAGAAFADDPIQPMPWPGLDGGDDPFMPVPVPVTPVDIPIVVPGQYTGPPSGGQNGTSQNGGGQNGGGQNGTGQNGTGPQADDAVIGEAAGSLAPVAVADRYTTDQDEALDVPAPDGLLINDTGDAIVVEYMGQPAEGAVLLERDGSFRYEPSDGFSGEDSFEYGVLDADGRLSEPVTVTIEVVPVAAPAAGSSLPEVFAGLGLGVATLATVITAGTLVLRHRTQRLAAA
jgi:hypothetical protein